MSDTDSSIEDVESDSDVELQEAFAKGLVKPGLNIVSTDHKKHYKNDVVQLKRKSSDIKLKLDWVERLDLVNDQAPLAPELALKLQEEELQHEARFNKVQGKGRKLQNVNTEDLALNDFRREMLFHRQAQAAVLIGIPKLRKEGVKTKRPDDYFAEMAKSDQHMQKVREVMMKKQHVQERTERVRQLRQLRKVSKQVQKEAKVRQVNEKKKLMEEVKKYQKGLRTDLDFLEEKKKNKKQKPSSSQGNRKEPVDKKVQAKRRYKDKKFGFGGKKRGMKRNTKNSTSDVSEFRKPGKPKQPGAAKKHQRPGKSRRLKMKAKTK